MKGIEAVKVCMDKRNYTQTKLALEAGFKGQSGVAEMLRREDIKVSNMTKLLTPLGYELVIKDKYSNEEIVITGE